jgi:nucleoside-diphosphate-sugar epimerase
MRYLMTGATGYVGSSVAERLLKAGHEVAGLARNSEAETALRARGIDPIPGDLAQPKSWAGRREGVDGFIHTAFNHGGDFGEAVRQERAAVKAVIERFANSGKLVLVVTATGVLGDTGSHPVDESFPGQSGFPAEIRKGVEADVLGAAATGVRGVVVRPAILVYGHSASQFVPHLVRTALQNREAVYVGAGENRIATVHVDDLADLIVSAAERASAGAILHGASGDIATRDLAEAIARGHAGLGVRSVDEAEAASLWGHFPAMLLALNHRVSSQQTRAALGWTPGAKTPSLAHDLASGSYSSPHFT